MWLPIMFDQDSNKGVIYLCFGCGQKSYLPIPNYKTFDEFVEEKACKNGCKSCGNKDFVFKDYRGRVYSIEHKLK